VNFHFDCSFNYLAFGFFGAFSFSSITKKQMACQQVLELLLNWCCYIWELQPTTFTFARFVELHVLKDLQES